MKHIISAEKHHSRYDFFKKIYFKKLATKNNNKKRTKDYNNNKANILTLNSSSLIHTKKA